LLSLNAANTQSLFALAVSVIIVFRFARRELTQRTIRLKTVWIRPVIMFALLAYMISLSAQLDPSGDATMTWALIGGAVLGLLAGIGIAANTSFAPAPAPNAVLAKGGAITLVIWIVALAIRLIARYAVPHGADPRTQLPLNCGTIVMTAVAFTVISLAFVREIRRYSATMAAPGSIVPGSTTRQ
jgi:peptidoglycan/LPS O-acetylase OafA/YrhL